MQRLTISLTEKQMDALKALCKESGLPISELMRRIIDAFFAQQPRKPA